MVLCEALGVGLGPDLGLSLGLGLRQALGLRHALRLRLRQALSLDENLGVLLNVVLGVGRHRLHAWLSDSAGPLDRTLDRALDRDDNVNIDLRLRLRLDGPHGLHLPALRLDLNGNRDTLELTGQGSSIKVPDTVVVDRTDPEIVASGESEIVGGADVEPLVTWLTISILMSGFSVRTTHQGGSGYTEPGALGW
jgi:hypothetical protein